MSKKKITSLILALVVVAALIFVYQKYKKPDGPTGPTIEERPPVNFEHIDKSQKPSGLPEEVLTVLPSAPILENYELKSGDEIHYTRKLLSPMTVDQTYIQYKAFFDHFNWKIVASVDTGDDIRTLTAIKPDSQGSVTVTINKNNITGDVTVDLTTVSTSQPLANP